MGPCEGEGRGGRAGEEEPETEGSSENFEARQMKRPRVNASRQSPAPGGAGPI